MASIVTLCFRIKRTISAPDSELGNFDELALTVCVKPDID